MPERRYALSVPLDGYALAEHRDLVQEAERLGYSDAWSSEVDGLDIFTPVATVAAHTNMRVGTAIANVYSRGPAALAQSAAGMSELSDGRFVFGIGSGSATTVETWNSIQFTKPVTRVREMVSFLRQVFGGERVTFDGSTFQVGGFRLSRPPAHPIPIHVAALREGMLRVAGEIADGCIINWLSAEDAKTSVRIVREAAEAAGRNPDDVEITARLMVMLDPDTDESGVFMRRVINGYLNVPVYRAFHEWLGRGPAMQATWDAWDAGDRRGAVSVMPQKVVDDLMLHGTAAERREHISRYLDAGVNTVFLQMYTAEQDPARKREVIAQGMREMAPAAY
ncbi:MAG: LLM class F420-dependent oxidoreductase [Dehalococcoidia bacterium]|nr:LLM class F420-dependent oxidoreductase [Dehalococcoidia bacterium]